MHINTRYSYKLQQIIILLSNFVTRRYILPILYYTSLLYKENEILNSRRTFITHLSK